jgi:hypothetical protein
MIDDFRAGFLIVGAEKCATTSLLDQLGAHPRIGVCREKEPNLFGHEDWRDRVEDYHALYLDRSVTIAGEATPHYTKRPEYDGVPPRIRDYNDAMRILYVMRHPVDRIVSAYAHHLVRGRERRPPAEAVERYPPYVSITRYEHQIRPYYDLFPESRILLLIMEEYASTQAETLDRIAAFLDVEPFPPGSVDPAPRHPSTGVEYGTDSLERIHGSRWFLLIRRLFPHRLRAAVKRRWFKRRLDEKPEFPPDLRRRLWDELLPEVAGIEAKLGRRLDVWRDREP